MNKKQMLLKSIHFTHDAWKGVLESESTKQLVLAPARDIAERAGDGFGVTAFKGDYGGGRWIGQVWANTYEARRKEAEDKTLSKAVG